MPLCHPVFDHLTLNARDGLAECCDKLEALGFALTPPSYQSIGAVNRCAIMDGAYLEVIAINPEAEQPRKELLVQPAGLNALVFRIEDAAATHDAFKAAGLPVLPPQEFSRMTSFSDGRPAAASFRVVRFEAEWAAQALPFGRVYFCQHLTPELIFDAGFVTHRNGCRAFNGVDVAVRDLAGLSALMEKIFGEHWSVQAPARSAAGLPGPTGQALLKAGEVTIRFTQDSHDAITACAFASDKHPLQTHETEYGAFRC